MGSAQTQTVVLVVTGGVGKDDAVAELHFDFKAAGEQATVRLDSQGFCNPPRDAYERPTIEWLALGDSFTECLVTDPQSTWPSQLGEIAGRSIYSLGRGGIGPYEYLQLLRHFGLPKQPRVVIMNVYEGNDLRDSLRYQETVQARRALGCGRLWSTRRWPATAIGGRKRKAGSPLRSVNIFPMTPRLGASGPPRRRSISRGAGDLSAICPARALPMAL